MGKSFKERVAEAQDAVRPVTVEQASALQGAPDVLFLDPRPADAIASTTGKIPGAWTVGLEEIAGGKLPEGFSKEARVITSCQAGPMGAIAAHELVKQGFTNVNYLAGGTQAWLDAGLPTNR